MPEELKREFVSIGEAFNALPIKQQEHGIRVGEYMKAMFLQACSVELYALNSKANVRFKAEYGDLMYVIGKYHDIGKALVPEEYHILRPVFSHEERALYREHAVTSAQMAKEFLEKEKKYRAIEMNFVEESIIGHHENWDGTGFPEGDLHETVSVLARMLKIADALDHLSVEKHSEQPLEYALEQLNAGAGTLYDPVIVAMLPSMKSKLKRIFTAYIAQTRAIPTTESFIKRSGNRPFELWYRPIADRRKDLPVAYEAAMRFRNKKEWQDYKDVDEIIRREKLGQKLGTYMLLEACDTLNRLDACKIKCEFIALELPTGWLNKKGIWKEVQSVFEDTGVAPNRICIDLGERTMGARTATLTENTKKLSDMGCWIMVTEHFSEVLSPEEAKDLSASVIRINTECLECEQAEKNKEKLQMLAGNGLALVAGSIEKKRLMPVLNKLKVRLATGPLSGDFLREDDLVARALAIMDGENLPVSKEEKPVEVSAEDEVKEENETPAE